MQGQLLLVGDVRGNSVVPHPVIIQVGLPNVVQTTPAAGQPETPGTNASAGVPAYRAVRATARGVRKDYALEGRPLKTGGQAQVIPGRHKATGIPIAFKKLRMTGVDQRARLRREVDVASMFGSNNHVMPVLDFCPTYEWFVMPLATHSAEDVAAELRDDDALKKLISAICEGLREAHQLGWIHRDLKPANILWFDGRWVIADWGLGRRPRGQTTAPGFTKSGRSFGSEGYAAPELRTDPHTADRRADIYSIGQIIGWAILQTEPRANIPHLPPAGPWQAIVRAATQFDPQQRPASVDDLLALIAAELDPPVIASQGGDPLDADKASDGELHAEPSADRQPTKIGTATPGTTARLSTAQRLVQRNRADVTSVAADQAAAATAVAETAARYASAYSLVSELWTQLVELITTVTPADTDDAAMRLTFDGVTVEFLRFVDGRFYPASDLPPLMWVGEIKIRIANAMFGEATVANLAVFQGNTPFEIKLMQFDEETLDPAGSREPVRLPRALNSHFMPRYYGENGATFGAQIVTNEDASPERVLDIVMHHVQHVRSADHGPQPD